MKNPKKARQTGSAPDGVSHQDKGDTAENRAPDAAGPSAGRAQDTSPEGLLRVLHDLRNRLGVVVGYAELVLEDRISEKVRRDVQRILDEAHGAAQDVDALTTSLVPGAVTRTVSAVPNLPGARKRQGKTRVLVVEDQPILGEMVVEALREGGFQARLCATGEEAIRHVHDEHYDLVLADVNLASTDGLGLWEAIRAEEPQLPFVFVTGNTERSEVVAELVKRGAPVLSKPFSIRELLEVVRRSTGG